MALLSFHLSDVACIKKGKLGKLYEFGRDLSDRTYRWKFSHPSQMCRCKDERQEKIWIPSRR